jgi:hypothetical protein
MLLVLSCTSEVTAEQKVPSEFKHNKVFVTPTTHSGVKLYLHTDTGGGGNVLAKNKNTELIVDESLIQSTGPDGRTFKTIPIPSWQKNNNFPLVKSIKNNKFILLEKEHWAFSGIDGQLGNTWFAGNIWKFDYINDELSTLTRKEAIKYKELPSTKTAHLSFKTDNNGERVNNFPRMFITVDQTKLPVLLDTGATTFINVEDQTEAKPMISKVGTSFITESIYRQWQSKHSNWQTRFEEYKGMRFEMIEVPSIEIAGFKTGPVWFTMKPDANFHQYMSSMMADHVEGAIGGSAFQYFSMVINYPNAEVSFTQPPKILK